MDWNIEKAVDYIKHGNFRALDALLSDLPEDVRAICDALLVLEGTYTIDTVHTLEAQITDITQAHKACQNERDRLFDFAKESYERADGALILLKNLTELLTPLCRKQEK